MKNWWYFISKNKRILNFGFMFSFFSLFGQTYFISLFKKSWTETFNISEFKIGSFYFIATIIAAFLLSLTGKYIDRLPLKRFGLIVAIALSIAAIFLSQSYSIVMFIIGLLLVRWLGQGMMIHTSATGIAKYFQDNKGKALSIAALGNSFAQFIIPVILVYLIAEVGWRHSLIFTAIASILIIIPTVLSIPTDNTDNNQNDDICKDISKDKSCMKTAKFWIIAINSVMMPFICTVIFFYQFTIGELNGWTETWVAFSFSLYPIFSAISLLLSGYLIDRFSGVRLFPLYLIPTVIILFIVGLTNNKLILPLFYATLGISFGLGNTIRTAVQVEIYGKKNLGKIASYFSTILVVSTAIGPAIYGYLIDKQLPINSIMTGSAIFILLITLLSFKVKN